MAWPDARYRTAVRGGAWDYDAMNDIQDWLVRSEGLDVADLNSAGVAHPAGALARAYDSNTTPVTHSSGRLTWLIGSISAPRGLIVASVSLQAQRVSGTAPYIFSLVNVDATVFASRQFDSTFTRTLVAPIAAGSYELYAQVTKGFGDTSSIRLRPSQIGVQVLAF